MRHIADCIDTVQETSLQKYVVSCINRMEQTIYNLKTGI